MLPDMVGARVFGNLCVGRAKSKNLQESSLSRSLWPFVGRASSLWQFVGWKRQVPQFAKNFSQIERKFLAICGKPNSQDLPESCVPGRFWYFAGLGGSFCQFERWQSQIPIFPINLCQLRCKFCQKVLSIRVEVFGNLRVGPKVWSA